MVEVVALAHLASRLPKPKVPRCLLLPVRQFCPFHCLLGKWLMTVWVHLFGRSFSLIVAMSTGSDDKLKKCLELGADVGINYKKEDFVERAKAETDGKGRCMISNLPLLRMGRALIVIFCIPMR